MELPEGVLLTRLVRHCDRRGVFLEAFRASWGTDIEPVQWNAVHSCENVLRGVHVHRSHADYLTVLSGNLLLGLRDIRADSPTNGNAAMLEISAVQPLAVTIPPGVAHGFYFPEPSIHLYAVSHYWDPADELGCRFDDDGLGLDWPSKSPLLSVRDAEAPGLALMMAEYERQEEVPS